MPDERRVEPPVGVVGVVKVHAPNAKGYYRLKWAEPDGTPGDTSAGRVLEDALLKATEIDTRVRSAAGPRATSTLAQVRDHYFRDGHSPYKGKKPWKGTNRNQIEMGLALAWLGYALWSEQRAQVPTGATPEPMTSP